MKQNKSPFGDNFRYLVEERIKNFWGYGNFKSDIWFIGMEEGHTGDIESLVKRLEATKDKETLDIYDDMKHFEAHMKWFEEGAKTQATYRRLIYILLYLKNKVEPKIEEIRQFQIKEFGRKTSNHTVLELMPLPAKSISAKDWVYKEANVEGLHTRKEYLATYRPKRIARLRELISIHKPKIVIFYSRVYLPEWRETIPVPLEEVKDTKLHIAKDHNTLYVVVPHSTSFGISTSDWKKIAETLITHHSRHHR